MTSPKPLPTRDKVFVWAGIAFVLVLSCGLSSSLIAEGVGSRRALAHGPVGTFTPNDRKCGDSSCAWVGTFASADGTVTEEDVVLKGERARSSGSMPATIDDVRLDDEATRPTAYAADYNWLGPVAKGSLLSLVGLVIAGFLVVVLKRHRSAAVSS
ncbi:hypothetical protein ACQEVC_13705 [Plantactinospora sp. CA-294935]|uniref:hypothetical protein n=1 Tax=Plantactinospora sp. CA-294935 TaxID=3240012 RepID=UPI003D8FE82B